MEVLTIAETAAFFKVTERTIHNWIREGKLTPIKLFGESTRFIKKDLEEIIASSRENVGNQPKVVA